MPGKIQGDYELQNFAAELATPKEQGGVGIKVRDDLVMLIWMLAVPCSCQLRLYHEGEKVEV